MTITPERLSLHQVRQTAKSWIANKSGKAKESTKELRSEEGKESGGKSKSKEIEGKRKRNSL